MTNIFIAAGCALALGVLLGFLWCYSGGYSAAATADVKERERQREIERRLLGRERPRHRATSEPAVIRSARVISSKAWKG